MADTLFDPADGIDENACLAMYDDDQDFYRQVLDTFWKEILKTCVRMQETFSEGAVEEYRILVHGLKGSGGSAGATHLVDLATRSNQLIKEGNWESAKELHEPMIKELGRLIELIPDKIN